MGGAEEPWRRGRRRRGERRRGIISYLNTHRIEATLERAGRREWSGRNGPHKHLSTTEMCVHTYATPLHTHLPLSPSQHHRDRLWSGWFEASPKLPEGWELLQPTLLVDGRGRLMSTQLPLQLHHV